MTNEETIRRLPLWKSDIDIAVLGGGITNHNYKVTESPSSENSSTENPGTENTSDRQFVVRLGSDIPVHHILRFNEVAASQAAHAAGLSPAIRHVSEGVLVMDYIPSVTLSAEQVRDPAMLERIVPLVKRCHQEIPKHLRGASVVFWVFHVLRDYAASLKEANSVHTDKLPGLLQEAETLETAAGPFDIVFGHNDLLPANILDDSDRLWLIDWEYGGFTTPLFDLGGLASNNELSEQQERWLLETYFDKTPDDALWRRYQAMKTASLMRETLWSMISEVHSTLDFDYSAYTAENLTRLQQALVNFKAL